MVDDVESPRSNPSEEWDERSVDSSDERPLLRTRTLPVVVSATSSTACRSKAVEVRKALASLQQQKLASLVRACERSLSASCTVPRGLQDAKACSGDEDERARRRRYEAFQTDAAGTPLERRLAATFAAIDGDGDGEIKLADLERFGNRAAARSIFERMDSIVVDGSLSMQEWVQYFANLYDFGGLEDVETVLACFANLASPAQATLVADPSCEPPDTDRTEEEGVLDAAARLDACFASMDLDGNGTINMNELADLVRDTSVSRELHGLLDNIQADGQITLEEFHAFFASMTLGDVGRDTMLVTLESLVRLRGVTLGQPERRRRLEDAAFGAVRKPAAAASGACKGTPRLLLPPISNVAARAKQQPSVFPLVTQS